MSGNGGAPRPMGKGKGPVPQRPQAPAPADPPAGAFSSGPLSVLDLTDAALSPQPTVTHAVRRLEARGLVTRTAGATDRRQRIVAVTEEGAALTRRLIRAARRLETAALADLGGGEDLVEPLRRLISSLEGVRA
jgi:DNA-binding MarR family transcriptional regulator